MPLISLAVASISAGFATFFTVAGVVEFALKAALSFGIGLAEKALAGDQGGGATGIRAKLRGGGEVPRALVLGSYATGGSLVWHTQWGVSGKTPNGYHTVVIALSDVPVQALTGVWFSGEKCTLDTANPHVDRGWPVTEYRRAGQDYLWVKFYDGTQTSADSFLVSLSTTARPWESTRVGTGVAYAIVTGRYNPEFFSGVDFQALFELTGAKLYDISKDSTAGGSGTQRWATPSTWGGDGDHLPAVQAYNILRGVSAAGRWLYGLQAVGAARLPDAAWVAAANACRATITGASGPEARYRSAGEIEVTTEIGTSIEGLLTACSGRISDAAGVFRPYVGAPGSPVMSFTDLDIISTDAQSFTPFFGLADTVNGLQARFPDPLQGWAMRDIRPRLSATLEAEDGGRRLLADVAYDFVPYREQADRLTKAAVAEARRARRHTLRMPPAFWAVEPGDVVSWTSARNGYSAKSFRVDGVLDLEDCDVIWDLTEVDPADHDYTSATDYAAPGLGVVTAVRPAAQALTGVAASAVAIRDAASVQRRPGVQVTWDTGELDDVVAIRVQVRVQATLQVVFRGRTDDVDGGTLNVSQGILPNVAYEVRARPVTAIPDQRPVSWSSWIAVTSGNIPLPRVDLADGAASDRTGTFEAGPLGTTSTSFVQLSTTVLTVSGLTPNQSIFIASVAYELRSTPALANAQAALFARYRTGGGSWSAWNSLDALASAGVNATATYASFSETQTITAIGDEYEFALFARHTGGNTAQARQIYLNQLVVRR